MNTAVKTLSLMMLLCASGAALAQPPAPSAAGTEAAPAAPSKPGKATAQSEAGEPRADTSQSPPGRAPGATAPSPAAPAPSVSRPAPGPASGQKTAPKIDRLELGHGDRYGRPRAAKGHVHRSLEAF